MKQTEIIKIDNKKYIDYLRDICKEVEVDLYVVWKATYNSYVEYDYEPFNTEGFYIQATLFHEDNNKLQFALYLYNNKISMLEHLHKCLDSYWGDIYIG